MVCVLLFCLNPYYYVVMFMLTYRFIVITIVLPCVPCAYKISEEVQTLKEHSNREKLRQYVTIMYLLHIFVSVFQ